jgi:hypothetical protein
MDYTQNARNKKLCSCTKILALELLAKFNRTEIERIFQTVELDAIPQNRSVETLQKILRKSA